MAERILYIEDEKFFAATLEKVLTNAGYEVTVAEDGERGIAIAKEWKPSIILLDLLLPKMDGFEVLTALQADPTTKQIPVVILSNLNSEQDVKKASTLGAKGFFVKALTMPTALVQTVKDVLSGHDVKRH